MALWPAAISTVDQELKKTRAIDNRVDLEQSLCGWADLLLALQAWWHSLDSPHRHYLKRSLEQLAPIVAEFLALEAPAVSLQVGTHLGRPVSEIFPGIFFAPVPKAPKADEEAWQAWRAETRRNIDWRLAQADASPSTAGWTASPCAPTTASTPGPFSAPAMFDEFVTPYLVRLVAG